MIPETTTTAPATETPSNDKDQPTPRWREVLKGTFRWVRDITFVLLCNGIGYGAHFVFGTHLHKAVTVLCDDGYSLYTYDSPAHFPDMRLDRSSSLLLGGSSDSKIHCVKNPDPPSDAAQADVTILNGGTKWADPPPPPPHRVDDDDELRPKIKPE